MLLDIEVENLKSFKEETVFSMEAEDNEEDRNAFEKMPVGNQILLQY